MIRFEGLILCRKCLPVFGAASAAKVEFVMLEAFIRGHFTETGWTFASELPREK